MNDNITVHLQVYKNKRAVEECISRFRKHFPTTPLVMHGDNGDNFKYLSEQYNFTYIHWDNNLPPIGFAGGMWRKYLQRLLLTCELFPNEWFLLFEEDINTLHNNIIFPTEDFSGVRGQPFTIEFENFIKRLYPEKNSIKYNTCGGSLIKMPVLINSINSVLTNKWYLEDINSLDARILQYLDVLLSSIFHLNGYSYGEWDQLSEISSGVYKDNPVFDHSWKEFYDNQEYINFRNQDRLC